MSKAHVILTKAGRDNYVSKKEDLQRIKHFVSQGYEIVGEVLAENGAQALERFASGGAAPTHVDLSQVQPQPAKQANGLPRGHMTAPQGHIYGYILLVLGIFAAFVGINELDSYRPDGGFVNVCFGFATLAEVVALIMIIVGHIRATIVKSHNLLMSK
ncbi:hypothetical protein [Vibrio sp. WXL210]|uniref:hypothetical protein n=1 Tax=Vibrio sp. WXL210 TaxID=3450709 RepID=UPI003EC87343